MSSEEDKHLISKKRKKKNRFKITNMRYVFFIIVLLACFYLLAINNIKAYDTCTRLTFELENIRDNAQKNEKSGENEEKSLQSGEQNVNKDIKRVVNTLLAENEYLKKINTQISNENISLQNSLKIAAMAGIKPKNYVRPLDVTSRYLPERSRYIGKFKGTAYTPSASECGNNKGLTASGKPIIPGTTIAVDTRYWPIGTVFYVKGIGYVTAMDTGSAVKGKNRFDFAVFDKKFAYALGVRYWDVYLVKLGSGKIN